MPRSRSLFILLCAGIACILTASIVSFQYRHDWPLVSGFPVSWLAIGLDYLGTFFHEIGHTLFGWLFGYPTLPSFDLYHGGGMAYSFGRYQILVFIMYAGIGAFVWKFRTDTALVKLVGAVLLFHAFLNFTSWHKSAIDFMGHGFELMIASFCIWRAWHDKAVNRLERWLNGVVGFGMIFMNMALFIGLIVSDTQRLKYIKQKGEHGFGDFSKIQRAFGFDSLDPVAFFALVCSLAALVAPFVLFRPYSRQQNFSSTDH